MLIKHNACTSETIVFPIPLFSQGTCFTIKISRLCKYRKHSSLQIQVLMVFVAKKKWYKNLVKIYPNIHQGIMDPNIFHIRISSSVPKWHNLKSFLGISRLNKKVKYDFKKDSTPLCIPRRKPFFYRPSAQSYTVWCGTYYSVATWTFMCV